MIAIAFPDASNGTKRQIIVHLMPSQLTLTRPENRFSRMFISCALVGVSIIRRFFYLRHKASFAMRQKDRLIEHKEQINYIELLNKMMVYLLTWQTGIQAMRFILGHLAPLTDLWLATHNGYHIVSDACRPHRDVDDFAGLVADELVFEVTSSA